MNENGLLHSEDGEITVDMRELLAALPSYAHPEQIQINPAILEICRLARVDILRIYPFFKEGQFDYGPGRLKYTYPIEWQWNSRQKNPHKIRGADFTDNELGINLEGFQEFIKDVRSSAEFAAYLDKVLKAYLKDMAKKKLSSSVRDQLRSFAKIIRGFASVIVATPLAGLEIIYENENEFALPYGVALFYAWYCFVFKLDLGEEAIISATLLPLIAIWENIISNIANKRLIEDFKAAGADIKFDPPSVLALGEHESGRIQKISRLIRENALIFADPIQG